MFEAYAMLGINFQSTVTTPACRFITCKYKRNSTNRRICYACYPSTRPQIVECSTLNHCKHSSLTSHMVNCTHGYTCILFATLLLSILLFSLFLKIQYRHFVVFLRWHIVGFPLGKNLRAERNYSRFCDFSGGTN